MIRSPFICLKHITFAILAMGVMVVTLEVALRVQDSYTGEVVSNRVTTDPLISPSWYAHHELRPLARFVGLNPDSGERVEITTNGFGLRGSEIAVPKPAGVYRILCLGDETTFAPGIAAGKCFSGRLHQLLQQNSGREIEVINAGVPGYCPLLSYLQVKHSLLCLQPDLMILNFDMSDVADDHRFRRHTQHGKNAAPLACPNPAFARKKSPSSSQLVDRFLIPRWGAQRLGRLWLGHSPVDNRHDIDLKTGRYAWLKDQPPDWSIYVEHALTPIDHLHQLARDISSPLIVATYPTPWQVSATASNGKGVRARAGIPENVRFENAVPFETIANFVQSRGILHCNTEQLFQTEHDPDRLFQTNAARISEEGHELYAGELARFVIQHIPAIMNDGRYPRHPTHAVHTRSTTIR